MHLDGTFLVVEFSPGIQAKTQINGRAVKSIDHIIQVNPEIIVINVQRSCLLDEYLSKVGITAPVSFLVGISKSRSGYWFTNTGMIQFAGKCGETVFNITQTFPARELCKTHDQKMLPTGKLSYSVVTLVMIDTLLELVFWYKCH